MNKQKRSHKYRAQLKISRAQLAAFLNVSEPTINNWDKPSIRYKYGDRWPSDAVQACDDYIDILNKRKQNDRKRNFDFRRFTQVNADT